VTNNGIEDRVASAHASDKQKREKTESIDKAIKKSVHTRNNSVCDGAEALSMTLHALCYFRVASLQPWPHVQTVPHPVEQPRHIASMVP